MPQIFVILGMHKSGTSLVSEMLHASGIGMVEDGAPGTYDQGNHHERLSTNLLNKELLHVGEASSLRVFNSVDPNAVPNSLATKARALVEDLDGQGSDWGFKDPRTCLTYRFWQRILPPHRLICVFRDVREVYAHYARRRSIDPTRGFRTLRAWHQYNSGLLEAYYAAGSTGRLLVDYATLMREASEVDRLASFIGRSVADRRLPGLKRSNAKRSIRLNAEAEIYRRLSGSDVFALNDTLAELADDDRRST